VIAFVDVLVVELLLSTDNSVVASTILLVAVGAVETESPSTPADGIPPPVASVVVVVLLCTRPMVDAKTTEDDGRNDHPVTIVGESQQQSDISNNIDFIMSHQSSSSFFLLLQRAAVSQTSNVHFLFLHWLVQIVSQGSQSAGEPNKAIAKSLLIAVRMIDLECC
jgi:hypothetical protein